MLPKEPRLHNLGKQPSADSRLHRADLRLHFADLRLLFADLRLLFADSRLLFADSRLLAEALDCSRRHWLCANWEAMRMA